MHCWLLSGMTNLFEKLRAWLEPMDHEVEDLPEGTFKCNGTNVRSLLVAIHK
jgi:hypothetical protein